MSCDKTILVIGSINADYVIRTDSMPKLGETVVGGKFAVNCGGKGFNQAVAIAKLGGDISFVGAVGNDENGKMLLRAAKEYGVNYQGITDSALPTGVAVITVVGADNCIVLDQGANAEITPQFIEQTAARIRQADYVVLQLEIPVETVLKICEIAKGADTKVVLNPAPFKALPPEIFPVIDLLVPNEHEARELTGIELNSDENCVQAVRELQARGVKTVVITLGDKGCVCGDGENTVFYPAQPTVAVDTTSAGDCFIGALVTKLSKGYSLPDAIAFATKASAITVSRAGASASIPYACEIE